MWDFLTDLTIEKIEDIFMDYDRIFKIHNNPLACNYHGWQNMLSACVVKYEPVKKSGWLCRQIYFLQNVCLVWASNWLKTL